MISRTLRIRTEIQKGRSDDCGSGKRTSYRIALGLALLFSLPSAEASEPPKDLLQRLAENGSRFERARARYTYRQTFHFFELDRRGARRGDYLEVRDITFQQDGSRGEEFVKGPIERLDRMRLTAEDFRDLREVQPFILTEDTLWLYETKYKGLEALDGRECYVFRIQPRQVLEGQRLLDGHVWVDREQLQIVRAGGLPVPQYHRTEDANLFPRFMTAYEPIDGRHWFPVKTVAEDTLAFPNGLQRVRYEILFENYLRFSADATVRFGEEP